MTVHGKLPYSRYVLRPKSEADKLKLKISEGITAVKPLDEHLGISKLPYKMTAELMLEVAYWAQNQCSYKAAEDTILKVKGIAICDDNVRKVTNTVGSLAYKNDCEAAEKAYSDLIEGKLLFPCNKKKGVLYIQTDGASVNTRQKANDGSTWKESKLGLVFSSDNIRFWTDKHGDRQHLINKREYTGYIGSVSEFKKHLLACALRNGYGSYEQTVIIADGATWIRNMKDELFPDAQQILDFYHLCENVNTFAKYMFGMNEAKYKPWADIVCRHLKAGKYQEVLKKLESMGNIPSNCPVNLAVYITNNINNIDYPAYIEKGYFIGSGAIESGNKIVLQSRLKCAGMRWNVNSAQHLLTLRAKQESDLWLQDIVLPVKSTYS